MIHLIADDDFDRPHGNQHTDKVTHAERREQMNSYYAMNRERISAQRRKKYQENKPNMLDIIELEAARICRIVNDEGPRLVIIIKGKPSLHKPESAAAKRHYLSCKNIVGTYDYGATRELIALDLREAMR
jgi:hypothetical protein